MPKISFPTVAEHRAVQHRAVLDAANRLIVENDGNVPTLSEVASEVGLARSSVYLYVSSQQDLVIQLLLEAIPAWTEELRVELDRAGTNTADRLAAYADVTLRLFAGGSHGQLMIAAQQFPGAFMDDRVQEAHAGLNPARDELLGDLGPTFPLLDAAIHRGADLIRHNETDLDTVRALLQDMARAAVTGRHR